MDPAFVVGGGSASVEKDAYLTVGKVPVGDCR
jgi:hypothetical protein